MPIHPPTGLTPGELDLFRHAASVLEQPAKPAERTLAATTLEALTRLAGYRTEESDLTPTGDAVEPLTLEQRTAAVGGVLDELLDDWRRDPEANAGTIAVVAYSYARLEAAPRPPAPTLAGPTVAELRLDALESAAAHLLAAVRELGTRAEHLRELGLEPALERLASEVHAS